MTRSWKTYLFCQFSIFCYNQVIIYLVLKFQLDTSKHSGDVDGLLFNALQTIHSITAMLIPTDTNSVSTQYQSVSTPSWDHHGTNT